MAEKFRITYATMSADNEELQAAYDEAAERARAELGKYYPVVVNGEERWRDEIATRSPRRSTRTSSSASSLRPPRRTSTTPSRPRRPSSSSGTAWAGRSGCGSCARSPTSWRTGLYELAALMAFEVGKSRLEALGDVQETAELIRWNCDEMEKHDGFRVPMSGLGAAGDYYDVLRPYGVWAVISPFNFPMALSGGPSCGALVAGNTVVLKPSNQGALLRLKLYECYRDGGVPAGRLPPGDRAAATVGGDHLWHHPDVNGITFTGSYPVGMDIYKHFANDVPKPAICEMGGKNPTIVTANADLDKATDGVMRSAFGFGGQKCSACSRVYVEREVYDDFVRQLRPRPRSIKVGNPIERDVYMGPIINEPAMETLRGGRPRRRARTARSSPAASASPRATSVAGIRGAHDRRGARGQPAVEEGAVRAVRGGRRRSTSSTRRSRRRTTPSTGSPPGSSARTGPRSTSGSTGSRRASCT